MKQLNRYILNAALKSGICEPWALKIASAENKEDLLGMYVAGIDFCIEKDFPSNIDLVNLGGPLLAEYGIYVDALPEQVKSGDFMVLLGNTKAVLHYKDHDVSQLYIKHNSIANINVANNAFVMIDAFDNTHVIISSYDQSKVIVNVYGDAKVKHTSSANSIIKIKPKNKRTY